MYVPVRQPYAGVDFIPQSGIYEFGYWMGGEEAEFLNEIQTKDLRVFLLAIHSHLYIQLALRFLFLQTHATSYSFCSSLLVTVHYKGERRKTKLYPFLYGFKKSIQKPQVWELSRLYPETSTKLYVQEFGLVRWSRQNDSKKRRASFNFIPSTVTQFFFVKLNNIKISNFSAGHSHFCFLVPSAMCNVYVQCRLTNYVIVHKLVCKWENLPLMISISQVKWVKFSGKRVKGYTNNQKMNPR